MVRKTKVTNNLLGRARALFGWCSLFLFSLLGITPFLQGWAATPVPARGIDRNALRQEQAIERWINFRKQFKGALPSADGARGFAFLTRLEKFPRRGQVIRRKGILYGLWTDQGLLRMEFPMTDRNQTTSVLLRNGAQPKVWRLDQVGDEPRPLNQKDLFAPLASGIDYSAFDALMPFVHWEKFSYQGSGRVIGRPAHLFACFPPEEIKEVKPDLKYVRVAVDDTYNALLRVEFFGKRGVVERKFSVIGFKKVQSGDDAYWIVKTIDLLDVRSRDKTRLRIEAAAVNLSLGPDIFLKENLAEGPKIPREAFVFFD